MAILEYMMNTQTISTKGKQLEELGNELQELLKNIDASIEELAMLGMLGKVKDKLSTVYEAIQPSMATHMNRIETLGRATQKAAVNTDEMATNVANAMNLAGQADMKGASGAFKLTSVKNVKHEKVKELEDDYNGLAGAVDSVNKMLRHIIKMKENLQKEYGFTDEEIDYLDKNYHSLLTSLYEASNQKEKEKYLEQIKIELKIYQTPVYCEEIVGTGKMSDDKINSNAEYIYWYLRDKGWSKETICGLLGNIYEESKVNPNNWEDGVDASTGGYGLVQYTGKDRDSFYAYMEDKGYESSNLSDLAVNNPKEAINCQLDYLMNSNSWYYSEKFQSYFDFSGSAYEEEMPDKVQMPFDEFQHSDENPACLALIFNASYERSGDDINKIDERGKNADEWYEYFKDYE